MARPPGVLRILIAILALSASVGGRGAAPPGPGERIYREGLLPDGRPMAAVRQGVDALRGTAAACATCHRRSGLGAVEGQTIIPPITAGYLFRTRQQISQDLDMAHVAYFVPDRRPYDPATLARAIRDGVNPEGRELGYLMPRFALDSEAMSALVGYLQRLGSEVQPGVGPDTVHFATIITPDADPARRQAMLEVMRLFFAGQNGGSHSYFDGKYAEEPLAPRDPAVDRYRIRRRWQLHVWELTGAADTWERQLQEKLAQQPVFAVLSGLSATTWDPIHHFCESNSLPCLFPNVDAPPPGADRDFYSVYFSAGVHTEAQLMAQQIESAGAGRAQVVQIYRRGGAGETGALQLANLLRQRGIESVLHPVTGDAAAAARALPGSAAAELALWLSPRDLGGLPAQPLPYRLVMVSETVGDVEHSQLPAGWRSAVSIAYPFDPPQLRAARMRLALDWFRLRQVPVVDERLQSDTYLACVITAATLDRMGDAYVRDYLLEHLEDTLSQRTTNGYFPRLTLAPGQRFASRGGYIARFMDQTLVTGPWLTP